MRCDDIQLALSALLDGERSRDAQVGAELVDRHLASCPDCQAFLAGAQQVRRRLRLAPLDEDVPEITAAVIDRLPTAAASARRPPRTWRAALPLVASLVVGMVVGGVLAGASDRQPSLAGELGDRVLAGQTSVSAFDADVVIEEHGWHPLVPTRHYEGTLRYAAPEQLALELHDRTAYPDGSWTPNDVTRVITSDAEWSTAVPACPQPQLPGCLPAAPRTAGVADRVPLSGLGARALEAVVPVQSLHLGGGTDLGTRTTDDGQDVGVAVEAAQVAPLLEALFGIGTWRELHPSDPAELWIDATSFTPRELTVRAAPGELREQWAVERGLPDTPGDVLVDVRFEPHDAAGSVPQPSAPMGLPSAAFIDGAVELPLPAAVPEGMQLHRSGTQSTADHDIATVTWTDGRAWLRLQGVVDWRGGRLFGDLGPLVRRVALPDGRVVYLSGDGQTAAIHADGIDLLVEGSVSPESLLAVASSIPVEGQQVPSSWVEAANATLADAARELPGLLVPQRLDGFGPPAVQVGDGHVVIGYAGSGSRELVVTQRAGAAVSPPVVQDVAAVEVRGRPGRYLPGGGELEWVEEGIIVSLRSDDLGLPALLRVAANLESHR